MKNRKICGFLYRTHSNFAQPFFYITCLTRQMWKRTQTASTLKTNITRKCILQKMYCVTNPISGTRNSCIFQRCNGIQGHISIIKFLLTFISLNPRNISNQYTFNIALYFAENFSFGKNEKYQLNQVRLVQNQRQMVSSAIKFQLSFYQIKECLKDTTTVALKHLKIICA